MERGIFCIEGEWGDEALSFRPTLNLLSAVCGSPNLYRQVKSRNGFFTALKEWAGRPNWKYPILYLSFHGFDRGVHVDDPKGAGFTRVDLGTISQVLDDYHVKDSIVHIGACSTLADDGEARRFQRGTKVAVLSGYQKDVPWVESLSFELLYFTGLQQAMAESTGLIAEMAVQHRERLFDSRKCHGLFQVLGFRMVVSGDFDE